MAHITDADLIELDRTVCEALGHGDESALPTLGYGEISLVLAWPAEAPAFACKRMPPFPNRACFDAYAETIGDYVAALRDRGIHVVETELRPVELDDGTIVGYVVQPILTDANVATHVLERSGPDTGHPLVAAVVDSAAAAVSPTLGLDAQLANWVWEGDQLTYIDVSTPLIWSVDGQLRMDLQPIVQAFPWLMRAALLRFVAPGIADTYRDLRKVYFDLCGNLLKEHLGAWLDPFLDQVNRHLAEPMTAAEVHRHYRSDRRLWSGLLRVRRIDRAWQRRVRRRPYPFLLPGETSR